jgi:hypothetical protein
MDTKSFVYGIAFSLALFAPTVTWATHPLITDDAGPQGQGHFQLEVNGQHDHDKENGVTLTGGQVAATLTYGITDTIDVAVGIPYLWIREESGLINASNSGFSDTIMDVKLRFYEKNGLSFAVKPGLSVPTGNEDQGLGTGKVGYHLYLIGMKEVGPWTFLANLGYIRNETDAVAVEKDIWHVSVATMYAANEHWKIVANVVAERNPDKDDDTDPVAALAGVIYSPTKDIDLDLGVKAGLTSSETDWSLLAGTTFRF